jgi:hypothetical protein
MRLIISFLLFFVLNTSFSQKNVLTEQEYTALQSKIRLNFNANVDSAVVYANQMAKSNDLRHKAFANGSLVYSLQAKGKQKNLKKSISWRLVI